MTNNDSKQTTTVHNYPFPPIPLSRKAWNQSEDGPRWSQRDEWAWQTLRSMVELRELWVRRRWGHQNR